MANETEAAAAAAQAINGQGEACVISSAVDESELVSDAVRSLPPHAVKDLLSIGVCIRCIFRLFGASEIIHSCATLLTSALSATVEKLMGLEGHMEHKDHGSKENPCSQQSSEGSELEPKLCKICLGILQFVYRDNREMVVKRACPYDFAVFITELVKQERHQIDNFSLEVSIPSSVVENEQAVLLYMKRKYDSELWFQEKFRADRLSAKDFLKLSITNPLETLLDTKYNLSSPFRIRLTYTHSEVAIKVQKHVDKKEGNKRIKTGIKQQDQTLEEEFKYLTSFHISLAGADDMDTRGGNEIPGREYSDFVTSEEYVRSRLCNVSDNNDSPDLSQFEVEKVSQPCSLTFLCYRTPVYICGRYLKSMCGSIDMSSGNLRIMALLSLLQYSRNVSQTRWIIDDERMGEASVEEIIGSNILPICQGDNYKFHAAGREDIDVRMLGSGRPFLIEVQNARHVPSEMSVKEIERKINSMENNLVKVKNVNVVGSQGWSLMREGEAEKQKQYAALVWISRSLEDDDLKTVSSVMDMPIFQRTPIRVLHRRSPLEREKIIHWMKVEKIAGSSQYFLLHLCTQAGTYIKEFVHGDLGRTHPSIGSILGCRAEILQLDVTDVKMDCFLTE
ncbi:hypothetical protein RHSIM_Rhsim07G0252700 [Rhododendron simsii]|uniref:tRNA pseudouridine(55) synthase n=1 Tax=Rhododendron simsii TaxID=118357 RepID=A0A834LKP9_RHOSS|nr:hypothetical protein RHSIM_Rhsim07G0252700 [Rhododendron simsii]